MNYEINKAHKFFDITKSIVEHEIKSGNTVSFSNVVDLTQIEEIRSGWVNGKKPTYTAFVVKAVTLALKDFPYANRRIFRRPWIPFSGTFIQTFKTFDIAVACERSEPGIEVATFVDVIRETDKKNLSEITLWLQALANCTEANNKGWRDYKGAVLNLPRWLAFFIFSLPVFLPRYWEKWRGGAVLISVPTKYGVESIAGSWTSPLGVSFGMVQDRVLVKNGEMVIRPTFSFILNWDRRVMAGAQAARFYKRIIDILENASVEMKEI